MALMEKSIYMLISRAHRGSQSSAKSHLKVLRPWFAQFANWLFAEEVHATIINLTSKRLSMYVSRMYRKQPTER